MAHRNSAEEVMKRANGKLPHIAWSPEFQCWCGYTFKGASRPIHMAAKFEVLCKRMRQRHEAMMKRRKDAEAARKWYEFKAKHDIA